MIMTEENHAENSAQTASRHKILGSLAVIGGAASIGLGTLAALSDTEVKRVFGQAEGGLDLKVDGQDGVSNFNRRASSNEGFTVQYPSESLSVRLESPFHLPILAYLASTVSTQQGFSSVLDNDVRLAAVADHHAFFTIPCGFCKLPRPNPAVHPCSASSFERLTRSRTYLSPFSVRDTHFSHDTFRRAGVNHRFSRGNWSPLILSFLALPLSPLSYALGALASASIQLRHFQHRR